MAEFTYLHLNYFLKRGGNYMTDENNQSRLEFDEKPKEVKSKKKLLLKKEYKKKEREKTDPTKFSKKQIWPILVLVIASFFSWAAWGVVVNQSSPFESVQKAIPLMYTTFFFAVATTYALLATLLINAFLPERSIGHTANNSIRQGIILAGIYLVVMIFQQFRVISTPAIAILVAMGVLIEMSIVGKRE
jgi:small-conductance mechanosensitive channel